MRNENLNRLTVTELELFDKLAQAYTELDIPILMADHLPQRGGILSEFVASGGKAYMAGGKDGQQYFKNVPQFTTPYDTFVDRDISSIKAITSLFPQGIVKDNFAFFCYTPMADRLWSRGTQEQVGGNLIASSEQNFREYFEEKTNLVDILRMAGLEKHIIPSNVIRHNRPLTSIQSEFLYKTLADEQGRVVVQECGEGNTEKGGGHSTEIATSYEDFVKMVTRERPCYLKVSQFISGSNSNLSLCVGNTVPSKTMLGAAKGELLPEESRFTPDALTSLQERAKDLGISRDNIIVNVQPGTLKVVGDPELTSYPTNGVGNQLNYNFKPEVLDEIYNIGNKLGTFMALCGKVGMCGLDLIITKDGHVYINELNDRQQGPTESASLNNEAHGLPGIHRESFLLNFANLRNQEVVSYLTEMGIRSREIYDASTQIPSPFYIKVCTLKDSYSKVDIKPGDYGVSKDEQGEYTWNLQEDRQLDEMPQVDITEDESVVRINTVSAKEGEFVPEGSQFLRVNGMADSETAPFTINEDGISVLAEEWVDPIRALYKEALAPAQVDGKNVATDATQGTPIDLGEGINL